ncbi:MAG: AAA family ATPase [Lachnospiraceae bacterium]|nr:AAA family ATPase [Lachnospiraceae bacterium]
MNLYEDTPEDEREMPDFYAPDFVPSHKSLENRRILSSPRNIYNYLADKVYGQDAYKKAISTYVYKALNGINSEKVILIAAESGTGKSYLISELAKIVPNMIVADSSSITASGYRGGNHVTTILNKVDVNSKDPSFIVLDEFNRFLSKGIDGGWSDTSLLAEVLVLFDDKDVQINAGTDDKPFWVNPKNIFFILLGSFSDITDQKKSHPIGFNANVNYSASTHRPQITKEQILDHLSQWPELIGRISRIIINPNMTEKDYLTMLKDPRYSPVSKLGQDLGINIIVSPQKMRAWSKDAYESGTGLRGVKNSLLEEVDVALFKNPDIKELNIH